MIIFIRLIELVAGCCSARQKSKRAGCSLVAGCHRRESAMHPKVKAFLSQFPWVTKYEEDPSPDHIRVSRIDKDILTRPRLTTWSDISDCGDEVLVLVDAEGNELTRVWDEIYSDPIRWIERFFRIGYIWHNSVDDALSYLEERGSLKRVSYALSLYNGVTVYKPPKGFTVASWLAEIDKRAEEELGKEIAAIDAEGKIPAQ